MLLDGVKNISDLMVMPGLINLDFADVQSVRKFVFVRWAVSLLTSHGDRCNRR